MKLVLIFFVLFVIRQELRLVNALTYLARCTCERLLPNEKFKENINVTCDVLFYCLALEILTLN